MVASPALAQQAEAGASRDDIIVTAQRRSERLEAVPMSITAVSAERIQAAGVNNVRDLSNVVPGFQLAASGTFPQPAIRGISATVSNFYDNNVAVYVDGLYQTAPMILNLDLPNVASVEVLKGPQGTLYGRNATGGAVLLNTLDPTNELHAKFEVGYARFNDKRASGYIAGPLDEKVSISLAANIRRSDGAFRLASRTTPGALAGDAAPIKQQAVRAKLKFDFTSDFSAVLTASNVYISDTRTNLYTPIENVSPTILTNASFKAGTVPTQYGVYAYDPENVAASKQTEIGLKLKWKTGIGTLQSVTGYADTFTHSNLDFDGTYSPGTYLAQDVHNYTFQQTIDYNIDAIQDLNLSVGAMYVDAILSGRGDTWLGSATAVDGTSPLTLGKEYSLFSTGYWRNHRKAWAAYIDATWNPAEHVFINLGGRYSAEDLSADLFATSGSAAGVRNPLSTGVTFKKFTPRASVRYEFGPRSSVYASYSQGFRGGNYTNTLPACVNLATPCAFLPAKQEEIDAFEAGVKTARSGFRFDVAGFYYNYRNIQITSVRQDPVTSVISSVLTNAPKAKIYGIEANVMWEPTPALTITAGGTWLHARYGSGFVFSGTGVSNTPLGINTNADVLRTYTNFSPTVGGVPYTQDLSGLMMTRSPNFSANLGISYRIPQGDGGWDLSTNARFTTKYIPNNPSIFGNGPGVPVGRQNEQRFTQDGYAIVNASITWTHPSGHYYVRLWANNLTDKQYILNTNASTYGTYVQLSDPRIVGGTIGFKL